MQPNFQNWLQNFEVAASKFNCNCPLTSMASEMALPYISKIASNQCICSKDWWEVWIVGRYCTETKFSNQWGVKDDKMSNYKSFSVAQSNNLLDWKPASLTNYQLILEQIFYIFCHKKIFQNCFENIVVSLLKVALNRGKKKHNYFLLNLIMSFKQELLPAKWS